MPHCIYLILIRARGIGYLGLGIGLQLGGGNSLHELVLEQSLIKGNFDLLAQPRGQVHCVGDGQAVYALSAIGNQRLTAQDRSSPSLEYAHVLLVLTVGLHHDLFVLRLSKALGLGSLGELGQRRFQLPNGESIVLTNDLTLIAGNLKAVGTGSVTGGGNEYAGSPIGILYVSQYVPSEALSFGTTSHDF